MTSRLVQPGRGISQDASSAETTLKGHSKIKRGAGGVHYTPMKPLEAAQRMRPLAERATHADSNMCVEIPFAARQVAKLYRGSDKYMMSMRRKSRRADWVPSWNEANKIMACAREAQSNL